LQEYNICFTTVSRKRPSGESAGDYIPELPSDDSESGVLPVEIKKLVDSRRVVKNLLKDPNLTHDQKMQYDIRQKALKLTANSMYGCLGFSHSRFFAKPLAALITSRGREILLQTKSLVEKMNLEVVYGDTDSIMINSNSVDYDEVFKLGAKIKQEVNKMYRLLELEVDGVYRYMLLLKKKKYAAVTMERKSDGSLVTAQELKGLDIVRRDWSALAANAGKTILSKLMSDVAADDRIAFIHQELERLAEQVSWIFCLF
jgi:DNA polymerase alpha subunit A